MSCTLCASPNRAQAALPSELIVSVLEYLPIDELWDAARVSRRYYASAWRAGLFIHRYIHLGRSPASDAEAAAQLVVFKAVLEHARQKDLSLSLILRSTFPADLPRDTEWGIVVYSAFQTASDDIFAAISVALPWLVYLSIEVPDHVLPRLYSALRIPAPKLRTLKLYRTIYQIPCSTALPRDLFDESAPLLRTLVLGTATLPGTPVPALRSVTHASLTYAKLYPVIDIHDQFPSLTSLRLAMFGSYDHAMLPGNLSLAGLALRCLSIQDNHRDGSDAPFLDLVERSIDLGTIPNVLIECNLLRWDEKLLTQDTASISLRISYYDEYDDILISVVPAHLRWRRLYHLTSWDTFAHQPVPISELPGLVTRLRRLRIDAPLCRAFLALELTFGALRDLHVDLENGPYDDFALVPPDYDKDSRYFSTNRRVCAPCPALEGITLFALRQPLKPVDSHHVAFLAHSLGQHERPTAERVVLSLVGVELRQPVAHTLLDETVSEIHTCAFAGRGSLEDYDGGVWDLEFFNRD